MAFKSPSASSSSIILQTDTNTTGTFTYPFQIPSDVDSICGKIWLSAGWNAAGGATVWIQTSEDGGTTWRDVSVTVIGGGTTAASMSNQFAHFIPLACVAGGTGRGISNYIGSVAASTFVLTSVATTAIGAESGMPMLSTIGRFQVTYTGTITTGGINMQIFAPTGELR